MCQSVILSSLSASGLYERPDNAGCGCYSLYLMAD